MFVCVCAKDCEYYKTFLNHDDPTKNKQDKKHNIPFLTKITSQSPRKQRINPLIATKSGNVNIVNKRHVTTERLK